MADAATKAPEHAEEDGDEDDEEEMDIIGGLMGMVEVIDEQVAYETEGADDTDKDNNDDDSAANESEGTEVDNVEEDDESGRSEARERREGDEETGRVILAGEASNVGGRNETGGEFLAEV